MRALAILAPLACAISAGCSQGPQAPTTPGVCWHLAEANGQARFNPLASNIPDLEHCAAQLEAMRVRFAALGLPEATVTGAYQGQFLFIDQNGVFTAQTYDGFRYPFLVRTGDGRLAVPGAMPQQNTGG
ncbi:MAG TPA: hypothetical protein VGS12_17555 [Caulobacteraceae bacterium]|nr:hypothetical protein [Caulobacteraceae bacterium]